MPGFNDEAESWRTSSATLSQFHKEEQVRTTLRTMEVSTSTETCTLDQVDVGEGKYLITLGHTSDESRRGVMDSYLLGLHDIAVEDNN